MRDKCERIFAPSGQIPEIINYFDKIKWLTPSLNTLILMGQINCQPLKFFSIKLNRIYIQPNNKPDLIGKIN